MGTLYYNQTSMCAKLNDAIAAGGAASLRHTILLFLNAYSTAHNECAAGCGTSYNSPFMYKLYSSIHLI